MSLQLSAPRNGLKLYKEGLNTDFELNVKGHLCEADDCDQEVRVLNRRVLLDKDGVSYEADPRHVELLARALGLERCGVTRTPGTKNYLDHEVADGLPEHEDHAKEGVNKIMNALQVQPRKVQG